MLFSPFLYSRMFIDYFRSVELNYGGTILLPKLPQQKKFQRRNEWFRRIFPLFTSPRLRKYLQNGKCKRHIIPELLHQWIWHCRNTLCVQILCVRVWMLVVMNLEKTMHYICDVKKMMVGSIFGQDRPSFFAKLFLFNGSNRNTNTCIKHKAIHWHNETSS
jgi:hypothetical protein